MVNETLKELHKELTIFRNTDKKILNLGCGKDYLESEFYYVENVDIDMNVKTDKILDLELAPWPWSTDSVDIIIAKHLIEHLQDITLFMNECHRVLYSDGVLGVSTPHYTSPTSYADPSHQHHLSEKAMNFYTGEADNPLTQNEWTIKTTSLNGGWHLPFSWHLNAWFGIDTRKRYGEIEWILQPR